MSFQVLPNPQNAPLAVAGLQRSAAIAFGEAVSGTPAVMTLRIVRLGTFDGSPVAGPEPTFWLSAGGPATPASPLPGKASILNQNDTIVAEAGYSAETFDVYRIDVTVQRPGSTWTLQIENNENQSRSFTAVVAGTDAEARQPWIKVPPTLALTGAHGSTQLVPGDVLVVNCGTGPLTIQPTGLNDPFSVIPPEDIPPNGSGHLTIQYDPTKFDPTKPGSQQQTLSVASNDTTAGSQSAHNHVIAVSYKDTSPSPTPTPPPPPQEFGPCLHSDGCRMYHAPATPDGPCQTVLPHTSQRCGHSGAEHPPNNDPV
ncbi:MAG: hypothetical protein WBR28_17630 [Mycobacterium sp.]